jgi:hypothetical protein
LQKKLRGLFGGAGGGAGGGPTSSGGRAIGIGSVVAGLVARVGPVRQLLPERRGRALGHHALRQVRQARRAGGFNMRLPWPIDRRTVVNVTEFRSFHRPHAAC